MTTVAAPLALALETLMRKLLFPFLMGDDFELVREFLSPMLTPVAWALCAVAILASFAGLALHTRLVARAIARLPAAKRELPAERARAEVSAFLIAASVPQIPCILSTVTYTLGAQLLPVLVSVAVASVGVFAQALRTRSSG